MPDRPASGLNFQARTPDTAEVSPTERGFAGPNGRGLGPHHKTSAVPAVPQVRQGSGRCCTVLPYHHPFS